jgi:hypothetical protein
MPSFVSLRISVCMHTHTHTFVFIFRVIILAVYSLKCRECRNSSHAVVKGSSWLCSVRFMILDIYIKNFDLPQSFVSHMAYKAYNE